MKYLLDTDTLIYWLNGDRTIDSKIQENSPSDLYVSVVNLAELYYGAYKSTKVETNLENVEKVKNRFQILKAEENITEEFGKIKSNLEDKGMPIGDFDILIATIAKVFKLKLITNNVGHYSRIGILEIENWKKA